MTWQGGKRGREQRPSPFARLKPLATSPDNTATSLTNLARALSSYEKPVRLHIQLVSGTEGSAVDHWEVLGGPSPKAANAQPQEADIVIVMRPDTWAQIAQGMLPPYEALYTGRLRVGGDFEAAKAITKYLTDPATSYVAPC